MSRRARGLARFFFSLKMPRHVAARAACREDRRRNIKRVYETMRVGNKYIEANKIRRAEIFSRAWQRNSGWNPKEIFLRKNFKDTFFRQYAIMQSDKVKKFAHAEYDNANDVRVAR
jgi:hypothetical protein